MTRTLRDTELPPTGANPGYAIAELERALAALARAPEGDSAARANAERRASSWRSVLLGMSTGRLEIGAREPVVGAPAWATLEVAHGGFATGALLAEGPREAHERELLARVGPPPPGGSERAHLNAYFVSDAGRRELSDMLARGTFRVNVPEEGALLVVAWLLEHGDGARAEELLDALAPLFARLRFYPVPDARPLASGSVVCVSTVAEGRARLLARPKQADVVRMNETLSVWLPLYDRVASLFLETVKGPAPTFVRGAGGALVLREDSQPIVQGGVPCHRYPEGWADRARALSARYTELRASHQGAKKPESGPMAVLLAYAATCARAPGELGPRDVGRIRRALAAFVTKHGAPGSWKHTELRARQAVWARAPLHADLARLVAARLSSLAPDAGLASLEPLGAIVTREEASAASLPEAELATIPPHVLRALERCLEGTLEELVGKRIVTSGEVLAKVLPQVTSQLRALALSSPDLRRVYAAVYGAFRKRRSLLLLHLASQVKLTELPWVRAMDAFRASAVDERTASRAALEQIATLHLSAFPETILPNKLVTELVALAKGAELPLPLTNELAADIFMGSFSPRFAEAARIAATLMAGTAYERYYAIPYERVRAFGGEGVPAEQQLAELCAERAGQAAGGGRGLRTPAANGMIIEQQQLVTTHNLAQLFSALDLRECLAPDLRHLAERSFRFVCRALDAKLPTHHARLRAVKDAAYAWRQMLFFLSFIGEDELFGFRVWAEETLSSHSPELVLRFGPAWRGLSHVLDGGALDARGEGPDGARAFLGWSTSPHWLLA